MRKVYVVDPTRPPTVTVAVWAAAVATCVKVTPSADDSTSKPVSLGPKLFGLSIQLSAT